MKATNTTASVTLMRASQMPTLPRQVRINVEIKP